MRLTVLEYGGEAPSPPLSMLFSAPGGTIGRGADNHLVLPDDTRQISRLQAVLQVGEAGARLKNLSPVCPIEINEKTLAQQEEHPLCAGDIVRIGAYLLRTETAAPAPAQPALIPPPAEAIPAFAEAAAALSPPSADSPPTAPMSETPAPREPADDTPAVPLPPERTALAEEMPAGGIDTAPACLAAGAAAPAGQPAAQPERDEVPVTAAVPEAFWENLIAEFARHPAPESLSPADEIQAPLAPRRIETTIAAEDTLAALNRIPVDPLALFDATPDEGPDALFDDSPSALAEPLAIPLDIRPKGPAIAPQANRVAELNGHFQAPRVGPHREEPPVAGSGSGPSARPDDLTAGDPAANGKAKTTKDAAGAFREGAGLEASYALGDEQLLCAGRLLACLLGGTMALLSSRTIIKREVKADLTLILERENNPLKLLPDANTVLKQMFGPPFPGFMAPEQAVDDAFHDLQAHQIGMLAGMRAALRQLLHKVSPALVEQQLGAHDWRERLLPGGRDSRAWAHYRNLHQAMLTAVEEDFHAVFGQAFLAAYDAEVELYRQQCRRTACHRNA